ncbi:chaperone [Lithospermum erythrorhizon]|uniref:Chaperone n=1 Tax=Lithospermum erythrorhizon TaxID=34254 RepID=A0AAV3PEV4_LITER
MATAPKRCLYEVLSLPVSATAEEIRSAYKRLALQRHPDKLVSSGVSESDATAQFQELVNAYEVLSDPKERAWYDSHRSQILYSNPGHGSGSVPDLFAYFSNTCYSGYGESGKGFYGVYGEVFDRVYENEVGFAKRLGLGMPKEAPLMGNLDSPYSQVTAFYNYWIGFVTIMDFCWVDQYDVMSGPNRKSRRVMEDENKKLRKKARREFNDTVRGLAEFVKKRDKRVIDMQVKRAEEAEKKRAEERELKKEMERLKAEKARMYEEPDWAKVEEEEESLDFDESLEEEHKEEELYCVACGKKFKSEKQWKNHEQSKKHKEKVAELRKAFSDEDKTVIDAEHDKEDVEGDTGGYLSADSDVGEIRDQFEESVTFEEEKLDDDDDAEARSSDENSFIDAAEVNGSEGAGIKLDSGDEEASILEAMLSERKNRKQTGIESQLKTSEEVKADVDSDEMDFMNYNKTKGTGRNKGGKKRRAKKPDEEAAQVNKPATNDQAEESNEPHIEESTSCSISENGSGVTGDDQSEASHKLPKQLADKKTKKEHTKPKKATKGGKQATTAKHSSNSCEKCGEEFESKNKLHKHLGDTGHAAPKFR